MPSEKAEAGAYACAPARRGSTSLCAWAGQVCKAVDTGCQSPRRPGVGERDGPDRCLFPISAGRSCRNHRHANSVSDHLVYGIEPGKADAQLQAAAGAGRVVSHLLLEGMTGGEADIVITKGLAKRDRPCTAHHMIARCNEHKPIFDKG